MPTLATFLSFAEVLTVRDLQSMEAQAIPTGTATKGEPSPWPDCAAPTHRLQNGAPSCSVGSYHPDVQ